MNEKQEFYLKRAKDAAIQKGGKCLSNKYIKDKIKLEFQCDKGHIWKAEAGGVVNKGFWCFECCIDKKRNKIEDVIKLVEIKGGALLSKDKYKNEIQKFKVKCSEGHTWFINYRDLRDGCWCPDCVHINKRLTEEEKLNAFNFILKIVKEKGGKCLSTLDDYKNIKSKLKFQCVKKHTWIATSYSVKKDTWCPDCYFLSKFLTEKERLKGLNLISKIAEKRGGKCLSELKDYYNFKSKLKFKCAKNHEWETVADSIKTGSWCRICCQSLSEKLFRVVLETIFNYKFPSYRPKWLKSDKNTQLEIDGYNKKLKLGFEYQGEQHFKFVYFFHRTQEKFEWRLSTDNRKKKILESKNIFMLYPTYKLKKEDYFDYIKSKIINTIYEKLANFNQTVDINSIYKII